MAKVPFMNNDLLQMFDTISTENDADIFMFCAKVNDANADELINKIRKVKNRKRNCALILTTNGGDPDAGYRIVRIIQQYYSKFILYVFGFCKSTGTLIAIGADKIVMGDLGEFGPLDIQLTGGDELNNTSGLSYLQSLISLNERIYSSFEQNFMELKQYGITTKTAAEIGSKLAIGIIDPIASQIDPLKLGDVQRSIKIASFYADRIDKNDTQTEGVKNLIGNYPSHSFVIDFKEMKSLFANKEIVRPNENEYKIEENLGIITRIQGKKPIILYVDLTEHENKQKEVTKQKIETNGITKTEATNGHTV